MRKASALLLVIIITLISLVGCNKADNLGNTSSILKSQQPDSSSVKSQSMSSTDKIPKTREDNNTNSQPSSSTDVAPTAEVKKETIWKLIDENKIEDITPVFETRRYILGGEDSRSKFYKNSVYGALAFFKVDGKTGVVDNQGEIKIIYEDDVRWCAEGLVDANHYTYDSEFKKGILGGHGIISSNFFDLNTCKPVSSGEEGPAFINIDSYIKNNYPVSGIYRVAYFKTDKENKYLLVKEKETDSFIILDDKGNPITGPNIQGGTEFYNGISAIKKDNKWGFIDLKGNMVLDFQYDYAYNFIDDTAAVCKDGKWGYIKRDGSIYKDFVFDATRSFYKGKAWAKLNGKWQIITK